ncbi:MAG TPA: alkaline phosphatase family protein [Victivallales bacterium]|nr:alkaline phosphatase family protein [Victivallales bacterium]
MFIKSKILSKGLFGEQVVKIVFSLFLLCYAGVNIYANAPVQNNALHNKPRVVMFVWDGLRPDSISLNNTPNLYHLMKKGVEFTDNHSSYPTFTMMNASSFATGDFAGETGFYGNTLWDPKANGVDSNNKKFDFNQPVFTEDYKLLEDLNRQAPLVLVSTLFEEAHKAGIKTAAIGKSGPAFFQDYKEKNGMNGIIVDEKHVYPLEFARELQKGHWDLPKLSPNAYSKGDLKLIKTSCPDDNNPTSSDPVVVMKDGVTTNPAIATKSPYNRPNTYLMKTYLDKVLPAEKPQLSVVWLRNPDTTEHNYGVGSKPYFNALKNQDQLLGMMISKLKKYRMFKNTDIIVVSDHGHSNVSGPLNLFPLRNITNGKIGKINKNGYSVSGDFRPADLLSRAGFKAYDGLGSEYDPVLTGIKADGKRIYQTKIAKKASKLIDQNGHRKSVVEKYYTTPSYKVPKVLPKDAVIVAENGGSTYFYIPSHNKKLAKKLVRFLQSREQFGAIFVDKYYGQLSGTLPLSLVKLHNTIHRNPAIIAGSSYNANAEILGMKGIEFNSDGSDRGMHGSFSPRDVHNTLIAYGPSFKSHFVDNLPTGNVDVPLTIAHILGLQMKNRDGRILYEALQNGIQLDKYIVVNSVITPSKDATGLKISLPTDPNGSDIDKRFTEYTIHLKIKKLLLGNKIYTYFDSAKAVRS